MLRCKITDVHEQSVAAKPNRATRRELVDDFTNSIYNTRLLSIPATLSTMAPAMVESAADTPISQQIGPHPSFLQVAKPFVFEQTIQKCMKATGTDEAREDANRLQGVSYIESVRHAMQLPVRTFGQAVVYYHRFRLVHAESEYNNLDAAAAALFTACKIEDTLKKSRDVLCAAYNLKVPLSEQLSSDDPSFEEPSRRLVGLERLMLEASGFDFRGMNPHEKIIKLFKASGLPKKVGNMAWRICNDLYRTYAPLKQTTLTMAISCLELAVRLHDADGRRFETLIGDEQKMRTKWGTSRAEIMETLLDLCDIYTHNGSSTSIGRDHPLDTFIAIRIEYNKEASAADLPRYTEFRDRAPRPSNGAATNGAHSKPSPLSPNTPATPSVSSKPSSSDAPALGPASATGSRSRVGERGKDGTVRFMLSATRAHDEKAVVARYFAEEWEEYEQVIERPARPTATASAASVLEPSRGKDTDSERETPTGPSGPPPTGPRGGRERERELERERRDRVRERDRYEREREYVDLHQRERERYRDDERGHRGYERERERDRTRDRLREAERERDRERERFRESQRGHERDRKRDSRYY